MSGEPQPQAPRPERLAKLMAQAGVGSRRACEEIIREGRVEVDGQLRPDPAINVSPTADIRVDGRRLKRERQLVVMLNKPRGVVCTSAAEETRKRAIDLVKVPQRLYTVGRLDEASEGLLLLTNDGKLAHALTHPSFQIAKLYRVKVRGRVSKETLASIREGVQLAEGKTAPAEVHIKRRGARMTSLELTLREGMNREVRRVFANFGHAVYELKRVKLGPLTLGKLPGGHSRVLTPRELARLISQVDRGAASSTEESDAAARRRRPRARPQGEHKPRRPVGPGRPSSGGRSQPKGGGRAEARRTRATGGMPDGKPGDQRGGKTGDKRGGKAGGKRGKPVGKHDKPADKPGKPVGKHDKPASKRGEQPAGKPGKPVGKHDKPAGKRGDKPAGKPGKPVGKHDKPADKPGKPVGKRGKPGGKRAGGPDGKPVDKRGKPGGKRAGQPAGKPGGKRGGKPVDKRGKPGGKRAGQPAGKPGDKRGDKAGDKRGDKAGDKRGGKAGDKRGGQPSGKRGGKRGGKHGGGAPRGRGAGGR